MQRKTISINVAQACREAWDGLWADNLRNRAKGPDTYGYSDTFYLTATDLERGIRNKVQAAYRGERKIDWAEWRFGTYTSVRISIPGVRGGLMQAVRNWLQREESCGRLESHNFGRGHISGARYRPAGQPLAPAEEETNKRHEERQTRDYEKNPLPRHATGMLCTYTPFHYRMRSGRGYSRTASKRKEVTCKACIKLLDNPLTRVEKARLLELEMKWQRFDKSNFNQKLRPTDEEKAERLRLAKRKNAEGWEKRMKERPQF